MKRRKREREKNKRKKEKNTTPPHHTTPHHSTPHHTTPHHSTPHHTTPHHTTSYLVALARRSLQFETHRLQVGRTIPVLKPLLPLVLLKKLARNALLVLSLCRCTIFRRDIPHFDESYTCSWRVTRVCADANAPYSARTAPCPSAGRRCPLASA